MFNLFLAFLIICITADGQLVNMIPDITFTTKIGVFGKYIIIGIFMYHFGLFHE